MHPESFFGVDPVGVDVQMLCALAGLALVGLIVGGFAALWLADRGGGLPGEEKSAVTVPELGLLALWRLNRALRKSMRIRAGTAGRIDAPARLAGDHR